MMVRRTLTHSFIKSRLDGATSDSIPQNRSIAAPQAVVGFMTPVLLKLESPVQSCILRVSYMSFQKITKGKGSIPDDSNRI